MRGRAENTLKVKLLFSSVQARKGGWKGKEWAEGREVEEEEEEVEEEVEEEEVVSVEEESELSGINEKKKKKDQSE